MEIFKPFMKEGKVYFITDLEPVRVVHPFKNIHVSPTKTLLELVAKETFEVRCIWIEATNTVLFPEDKDAWELAKYFVLQGEHYAQRWLSIRCSTFHWIVSTR